LQVVDTPRAIDKNIDTLGGYMHSGSSQEVEFARDLVTRGICFVVTTRSGAPFFAPSRFVGYIDNQIREHLANADKDGRVTNAAISRVLGRDPEVNPELDGLYQRFCADNGIASRSAGSFGLRRKYWDLR